MSGNIKQSELLCKLAEENERDLWCTPDRKVYARIPIDNPTVSGHYENHSVRGQTYKGWLRKLYYERNGKKVPNRHAVNEAVDTRFSLGLMQAMEDVFVRVAESDSEIWVDLANPFWETIRITARGWSIVDSLISNTRQHYSRRFDGVVLDGPLVKFRRPRGMLSLPHPTRPGDLNRLLKYLNLPDGREGEDAFKLIVAWLVQAVRPHGPYPVLVLSGEQGSAKSTVSRVLKELLDPSSVLLRTTPRDERDLAITASNNWMIVFDNLSGVSIKMSDALCRLATGGGFSTRQLYTDEEEMLFSSTRPTILNGIDSVVSRNDLADRSIFVNLPAISETERITEKGLMAEFEKDRPYILAGLFDATSTALRNFENVELEAVPRMADFATWVAAAEPALPWAEGEFLKAYVGNIAAAVETALASDPVGAEIQTLMADRKQWHGTLSKLLETLEESVGEKQTRLRIWPKTPHHLSRKLTRLASFLRRTGLEVEKERTKTERRVTIIRTQ